MLLNMLNDIKPAPSKTGSGLVFGAPRCYNLSV